MEQEVLVLFARPYSFKNEEGQQLDGVTVYYLNKSATNTAKDGFGYMPVKATIESADALTHLPGIYNAHFNILPTARGVQLKLTKFDFVEKVDLWNK